MSTASRWRKSSFSQGGVNECVELDRRTDRSRVRDSKNPGGPVMSMGTPALSAFLATVTAARD